MDLEVERWQGTLVAMMVDLEDCVTATIHRQYTINIVLFVCATKPVCGYRARRRRQWDCEHVERCVSQHELAYRIDEKIPRHLSRLDFNRKTE